MAKKEDIFLTKEGLSQLEEELNDLKQNKRKEVAVALKEAKEFGDLSENTDWDDAKAVEILRCCREAMAPGGRVLVVEAIVKPGNEPDPIKAQDEIGRAHV